MGTTLDSRPDPDQLLEQMREEEARARRGRLRIYFGASAGVGKTYAMLSAAQRELKAGRDVLVGVVETHGRSETAELLAGLPQLGAARSGVPRPHSERVRPRRRVGTPARRCCWSMSWRTPTWKVRAMPSAGRTCRSCCEAGIDVWSAVNVQHLESLNGTVGAITGVRVHETVPDTVLDEADEIILVDVTADELTARLKAGKVYLPQQAERAAQNFFRKGNLIALREIALRRTAEHVEDDVRGWRIEQSGASAGGEGLPAWNTSGAILACIGPHEGAEQTVRTAARLAGQLNVRWHAAYVETPQLQRLPVGERDRILAVLKLAEELGAATAVLAGDDIAAELVAQAQKLNCAIAGGWPSAHFAPALGLGRTHPDAPAGPACADAGHRGGGACCEARAAWRGAVRRAPAEEGEAAWHEAWPRYAWAAAASVAITLAVTPLRDALDLANIVMLFLLGTVGVALKLRARAGSTGGGAQCGCIRFLLRAAAPVVRCQRCAVPGDVCRHAGRGPADRPAHCRPAVSGAHFVQRASGGRNRCSSSRASCRRRWKARRWRSWASRGAAQFRRAGFGAHHRCARPAGRCRTTRRPASTPSVADWAFRNAQAGRLGDIHAGRPILALRSAESADAGARRAGAAARASPAGC